MTIEANKVNRPDQVVRDFFNILEKSVNLTQLTDQRINVPTVQIKYFASYLNLHPNYLSNVIKRFTGETVCHWVRIKILSVAMEALKVDELSIKQISFGLYFSDPSHFSNFFKRHMNCTPLEYRESIIIQKRE